MFQLLDVERPPDCGYRGYKVGVNGIEDQVIRLANKALAIQPNNHHLYNSKD